MKNPLPRTNYKTKVFLIIAVVVFFLYEYHKLLTLNDGELLQNGDSHVYRQILKNLINTSICQVPAIDPLSVDFDFLYKIDHISCRKLELLTYIEKRNGLVMLHINASLLQAYSSLEVTCCYSKIFGNDEIKSGRTIKYSRCIKFKEYAIISHPYIRVNCSDANGTEVYRNVHATTIPTMEQRSDNRKDYFSVLLVGIDGTSKFNLAPAMPKSYGYLEKHFINLKGYSAIGTNVYTYLMSILTGDNRRRVKKLCGWGINLKSKNGLIWDTFKNMGYVTAYAEETCVIGNSERGFIHPPTDYYFRPYMLAAAELQRKYNIDSMSYCYGPEAPNERIFNIIKDFSVTFKNVPKFGLAWISSIFFGGINTASAMDETVLQFLNDTTFKASLENTFLVLFSNHGFIVNNIRVTYTGWLQERMPIMYIHVPESFKQRFPEKYKSFLINTRRLTTPYDLYNTLQEILELSNNKYVAKRSVACPKCRSLFQQIDKGRSCEEAAIDPQWCTCTSNIDPKGKLVQSVAIFIVNKINAILRYFPEGHKCANYNVKRIISANMSQIYENNLTESVCYFFMTIQTEPNSVFEAIVKAHLTSLGYYYEVLGQINRLNEYRKYYAYCIDDVTLEKYCYCY